MVFIKKSMQTFISILRGINVSGTHLLKMAGLQSLYLSLGFKQVRSYIQSGNLVFQSEITDMRLLEALIRNKIESIYSFTVPVFVMHTAMLKKILRQNPFLDAPGKDPAFFHISFLDKKPDPEKIKLLQLHDYGPDQFFVKDQTIYLYCPNGYGKTKLSNTFLENKLKVNATTRNWKTGNVLLKMAAEIL
jgi:uncharacterized protein (DUF1697 family)